MANILKGLSRDNAPLEQPDGTYPFAKNGVQYDTKGLTKNELGFNIDPAVLPGEFNGVIETEGPAIIFSIGTNGVSYIGLYDPETNTYTDVKDDSGFPATDKWNFDRNHYITGEYQRNHLSERIVAWTNKVSPPRMLNLDNLAGVNSAKDTLLFLQAETPTIDVEADSGGILEKGAYFIAVKLLKNDGSETGYLAISKPEIISSASTTGSITDQALNITVSNIDQSFDKIQLAIVRRKDGVYSVSILDPVEVVPGQVTAVYTGENLSTPGTIDEILVSNAVYSKVGTMGQLNDALYIADLEKEPELNMQQYANLVKVRVKSELISVVPPVEEHIKGKKKSLMHQEVYALYIRYHKTVGTWTGAFHIPGNAPLSADLLAAAGVHEADLGAKAFQVQDTCRNLSLADNTCDSGIWVNETELYPDLPQFDSTSLGGANYRGLPVRHHRMPSLAFCKDNFYPGSGSINGEYGKTKLDILGLEVSNVIIPPNLAGTIDGYEIMIAKRTLANSTVLGQSLLLYSAQPNDVFGTGVKYISTGGNWGSITTENKDLSTPANMGQSFSAKLTGFTQSQQGPTNTPTPIRGARVRLHSFDMLFNKPATKPAYIAPQYKLRKDALDVNYPNGGYIEDGEINDAGAPVVHIIDYTKGNLPTTVDSTHRVRVIEEGQYVPNNVNTGEYENTSLETAWVAKLKWIGADGDVTNNALPIAFDYPTVNLRQFQRSAQKLHWEETYLVNLMDIKADLYNSFYSQPLVASGQFIPVTATSTVVYLGDTYLNDYTYHTYGWTNGRNDKTGGPDADENWQAGYKIARRFICEAVSNINLRYEITGNQYSKWWPHNSLVAQPSAVDTNYLTLYDRREDPNQFGYSKDLNTLNDFGNYTSYNPYVDDVTKFPFRIHRLGKMPRQGKTRSWRTALPLDYYEAQKNRGRITKLLGKEDRLIIHHENAIFQTQDKAKLDAGILSVTLGAGDIFQFEPQEAQSSKQGYAGLQHELAGIDTPWGYVFVDAKAGQIFMKSSEGLKLMNQGLNQFFRQYLKGVEKNPLIGNGITLGYDPTYKRILLTVKNTVVSTSPENFVPGYEETAAFYSTLVPGTSIVLNHGRYLLFLGPNTTEFDCSTNVPPVGVDVAVTIPENTVNSTVVYDMSTKFSDADPGDIISYAIMGGNPGSAFTINPVTGVVKVNNSVMLDYETRPSFALVIRGTDSHGLYDDAVLTVNLTNVPEPPLLHDYQFSTPETSPVGTNVGQVVGTDPEGGSLAYALVTAGSPFTINATTGMITVNGALDYEIKSVYDLVVRATSSASGLNATCNVRVLITNVNENPVGTDATVTVYKDIAHANDIINTMIVSDPDNDSLTVTWLNSVALGAKFAFDPTTLRVTIIDPSLFSAGESYVLTFSVDDGHGGTDTFSLTVNIAVSALTFEAGSHICMGASCGSGDVLAPDNSYCYHYDDTAATPPVSGTPITTAARSWSTYGREGTAVYDPGFTSNGVGTYTKINLSNPFWRNIPLNTISGVLNRCGLWANDTDGDTIDEPLDSPIGFTVAVNIPVAKTYYIGVAGDNQCQIKINGVVIVNQDITAINASMSAAEGHGWGSPWDPAFYFWHVYPVPLLAGSNYIELTGINADSGVAPNPGAFGAEIYDATFAELEAATSYTDLGAKLIFSTKNLIGQNLQLGGTIAWSCPTGYSLVDLGGGSFTCRKIISTAPSSGYTKRWTSVVVKDSGGNVLTTLLNLPGQTYMGQAVTYFPDEPNSTDCGYVAP